VRAATESQGTHGSSSSGQQCWSLAVQATDNNQCVVCQSKRNLESARHIGVSEDLAAFEDLKSHNEVANGFCMCANCHMLYEASYFWIDKTIIKVSEALQQEESSDWKARDGQEVTMGVRTARNRMTDEMRDYRKAMYDAAQKKRHDAQRDASLLHTCQNCGKELASIMNKLRHEKQCTKTKRLVNSMERRERKRTKK